MDKTNRILGLLYDRNGPVWMAELASAIGTDVAAVDAAIAELTRRGHTIKRGPDGVRLARPTVLDAHLVERDLGVERIGRHVVCFGEVDSTNDVAFGSSGGPVEEALVVTAESQRAGRGRLGRTWLSEFGAGLLTSVLLHRSAGNWAQEGLTLAAGVSVAEGVDAAAGVRCRLEWPNDVMLEGAKLAGVLVEVRDGRVVVGVGVNVAAAPPAGAIDRRAVCLAGVVGGPIERIDLLRSILRALDARCIELLADRTDAIHDAWADRCVMINRRVRAAGPDGEVAGRVLDVSPTEGLILETDAGIRLHLPAATSSIIPG